MLSLPRARGPDARRHGPAGGAPRPAGRAPPCAATRPAARRGGVRPRGVPTLGMSELARCSTSTASRLAARVATAQEAAPPAEELGFPVALKMRSPDISHKTDVGGVHLGLQDAPTCATATTAMLARVRAARPEARIDGVLVQPMAPHGKELLLGMIRDPQFGPMVVVGFGGIYVEILKDTAARSVPSTNARPSTCSTSSGWPPCSTAHGGSPVDKDASPRSAASRSSRRSRRTWIEMIRSWPVQTAWSPWTHERGWK